MLSGLKLSTKISMGYVVVVIFVVVAGVAGIRATSQVNELFGSMYRDNLVPIVDLGRANAETLQFSRSLLKHVIASDQASMNGFRADGEKHLTTLRGLLGTFKSTSMTGRETELIAEFESAWVEYVALAEQAIELSASGQKKEAMEIVNGSGGAAFKKANGILSQLIDLNREIGRLAFEESGVVYRQARTSVAIAVLFGLLASLALGLLISRRVSMQLGRIAAALSSASERVTAASSQLSTTGHEVSAGASEAASSLEETVASLEQLSSMVKQNTDNAQEAAKLSDASTCSAEAGETAILRLASSMKEISISVKKINEIINVIDDLAFQTNLLSLNAAVEAARAGEQGRGFAVVAEAVRALAGRSAAAAKDISGLINESNHKIEAGCAASEESALAFREIVAAIQKVTVLNKEIASGSAEQASGLNQINIAMSQLDSSTQQNAAASEELATSAQSLSDEAVELSALVSELRSIVKGDGSQTVRPALKPSASPEEDLEATSNQSSIIRFEPKISHRAVLSDPRAKGASQGRRHVDDRIQGF